MSYDPTGRSGSASNNDGPTNKSTNEMMHQGQDMIAYRTNKAAAATQAAAQAKAAAQQTASRPPNGQVIAKAVGNQPKANVKDYVDMITHAAFGGVDPTAAISGRVAPVPHTYTGPPRNGQQQSGGNDDQAVQDALDKGISLEQIAAGAIGGAGTAVIARSIIDAMNGRLKQTDAAGTTQSTTVPAATPRATPTKSGDILTRNGLVSGQPSVNGDIDANFYEVFGLPSPARGEPRLVSPHGEGGPTIETSVPSGRFISGHPGPNDTTKRLGGPQPNSAANASVEGNTFETQEAQRIKDQMDAYGITDPAEFGITQESSPSLFSRLKSILN